MKKLLIKWLCKPCKEVECIYDLSRVYFGSLPSIGNPLFYLHRDEQQNDEYKMLEDGTYTYKGKTLVIENELVKTYE
mgnify:FL=1|nr:hypothetical protein [uncultured Flavobacterium sp.]